MLETILIVSLIIVIVYFIKTNFFNNTQKQQIQNPIQNSIQNPIQDQFESLSYSNNSQKPTLYVFFYQKGFNSFKTFQSSKNRKKIINACEQLDVTLTEVDVILKGTGKTQRAILPPTLDIAIYEEWGFKDNPGVCLVNSNNEIVYLGSAYDNNLNKNKIEQYL